MGKRRFGRVRRLPSGRWQARYPGPDGTDRPAPETFPGKTAAEIWLTMKEAEIRNGDWIDPGAGAVLVSDYGEAWIAERPGLRPKTVTLYRYLLRACIVSYFQTAKVSDIKLAAVRRWRKKLLDSGVSEVTAAKAYRLLRAILSTAVDDGLIRRNPCRIKGAGIEHSPERPVLTISHVYALAVNDHVIPQACDHVIPQDLAPGSVLPDGLLSGWDDAPGPLVGPVARAVHEDLVAGVDICRASDFLAQGKVESLTRS